MLQIRPLILAVAALAALGGCHRSTPAYSSEAARSLEGKPFPEFDLPRAQPDTGNIRNEDLRGRAGLVVFWATWCPGCMEEMETLRSLHDDPVLSKTAVALLSVDDPPAAAALAVQRLRLPYPVGLGAAPLLTSLQLDEIPQSFVLDPQGRVFRSFTGAVPAPVLVSTLKEAAGR